MRADYVIIGAGLTGGTIARLLADAGRDVLVLERRGHVGGNVSDFLHESGIRIHTYGPHYFRTSSARIWSFVNRFSRFWQFEATVMASVDGILQPWPVSKEYIHATLGREWVSAPRGTPTNFEQAVLRRMPTVIYDKFVRGYTEKQWGVRASFLSVDLAKRVAIREDNDPRLTKHRWQGIPADGYASFMANLFRGIPVILNCDYLLQRTDVRACRCLVYTGPIDEFFDFDLGRLAYRAQRRTHTYHSNTQFMQPVAQVNYPTTRESYIRTIEWKHLMPSDRAAGIVGTVLTRETPFTPTCTSDYEYPFPDSRNHRLYQAYRTRAESLEGVIITGRLGEYRYYDMDQAVARAMVITKRRFGIETIDGTPTGRDVSLRADRGLRSAGASNSVRSRSASPIESAESQSQFKKVDGTAAQECNS